MERVEQKEPISISPYTNLAFEGGGVNGVAYAGALRYLDEYYGGKFLTGIKNVTGSSVGSIVAAAIACGATADYLENKMRKIDFSEFLDDSWGVCSDVYRVMTEFGWYKGDTLLAYIAKTIQELTGNSEITFEELYQLTGKNLVITGTNVNKMETIYFSRVKFPSFPVKLAVRISSSFPFFFRAEKVLDCYWVDGGLLNNFPIGVFDTKRYCSGGFNKATLGFKIVTEGEEDKFEDPDDYEDDSYDEPDQKIDGIKDFSIAIGNAVYNQCQRIYIKAEDWERTIKCNVGKSSSLNFKLTSKDKEALIQAGYLGAKEFIGTAAAQKK
jgi:NTE family protein